MENAATLASVWSDVASFFQNGLGAAITVITGQVILTAPLVIWVASKVLGQAKSLFKISGRRR